MKLHPGVAERCGCPIAGRNPCNVCSTWTALAYHGRADRPSLSSGPPASGTAPVDQAFRLFLTSNDATLPDHPADRLGAELREQVRRQEIRGTPMSAEGIPHEYVIGMDDNQMRAQQDGYGADGDTQVARVEPVGSRGDIQVIARVAALLERVSANTPTLDAKLAGEVLGVGRSTAHRYLASMEKAGLLRRQDAATYVLGPVLVRLGAIAFAGRDLLETAGPVMRDLAERIAGTIILGVWGGSAPVVARVERNPYQTTTVALDVGRSLEPDSAQAILFSAFRSRADGHAVTHPGLIEHPVKDGAPGETVTVARQEYAEGALKGLAVPVVTPSGDLSATLAVLGFAVSLPDSEDEGVIDLLLAGARELQVS